MKVHRMILKRMHTKMVIECVDTKAKAKVQDEITVL